MKRTLNSCQRRLRAAVAVHLTKNAILLVLHPYLDEALQVLTVGVSYRW